MASGLGSVSVLACCCMVLVLATLCRSKEFVFRNGEQVTNIISSGTQIVVGTTAALYDIAENGNGLGQVQRRQLNGPSRLLVDVNKGNFNNLVLSCDSNFCFLAEISNFNSTSWSVASSSVLRPMTTNSPGLFALSADSLPGLLYVDSATVALTRRVTRGTLLNVNLAGPPSNSMFQSDALNDEARVETMFRYYFEFSHDDFLYLIADRDIGDSAPITAARILRFCSNDSISFRNSFRSYMELKLACGSGTSVTAATFVGDNLDPFGQPTLVISAQDDVTGEAYICTYSLARINAVMQAKFDECLTGQGKAGFLRYGNTQLVDCREFSDPTQQPTLCRFPGDYQPGLEVADNLQQDLLLGRAYPMGEELTSLTTARLEGNFYIFAGSNRANLHQYAVNTSVSYIRTVNIEATPTTISHLITATNSERLFAVTSNKIVVHGVDQCSLSRTCSECLSTGDSLCGWCTLMNSCVSRPNCMPVLDRSSEPRTVFVDGSSTQCPAITAAIPSVVHLEQITGSKSISLMTANILNHAGDFSYQCVYKFTSSSSSSTQIITTADPSSGNETFTCPTPRRSEIPAIPAGTDHVNSLVTLQLNVPSSDVATPIATTVTPISFTNCSVHTSCASCRGSVVGMCLWCPLTFACVSDLNSSSKCPSSGNAQLTETPQLSCSANILSNPSTFDYLIHANHLYGQPPLRIYSMGLDIFTNGQFSCRICRAQGCDSIVMTTKASLANDIITCELNMLQYDLSEGNPRDKLYLQVLVNNSVIDNPNMTSVIVFSCPYLGTNCAQCLTIDATNNNTFNCSYCGASLGSLGQCLLTAENSNGCSGKTLFSTIEDCDAPAITDFTPKDGPTEGGTVVSVTGNNLGLERSHITKVLIGGVNCSFITESYRPGIGFRCTTSAILSSLASEPVTLYLSYLPVNQVVRSSQKFSYFAPSLMHPPATPNRGPMAGGTMIEVKGSNIGIGSSHSVLIRNVDCPIMTIQRNSVFCKTPPNNGSNSASILKLTVDQFTASDSGFDYTANPVFKSIEPQVAFYSGGTTFTVRGEHLDVVKEPLLIFYLRGVTNRRKRQDSQTEATIFSDPCRAANSSVLTCDAPAINSTYQFTAMEVSIGLLMDGVSSLLELNTSIMVYSDPIITQFPSVLQFRENANFFLTIRGRNFVFLSNQVQVLITPCETSTCACTHLQVHAGNNSIVCQMRDPQDLRVGQDLSVTVLVGSFSAEAGKIRVNTDLQLIIYLVPVFAFIIIFCVAVFIVLFAVFFRKARQKDERYDQLMVELEKLESSVARECKLGFAELQTDLDELTGDVTGCRLPYHHLRTYLLSTLFPGSRDHSVLQPLQVPESREKTMQRALSDFSDLLGDRKILLFLIQTLEEQRSFTIRDKSVVGSLLVIILHNRMDYATDVLKKLLSQLIRKTVANSNPKLLLRRTESIAEKMLTNWLNLCLHGYIMDHAGQPMYLLYRAVKSQLEKGPVDVITGEARYSLSEQKLIRQKVDVVPINATVEVEDGLRVPVKLLDCDTISQAKEKLLDTMFKAAPVSQRPKLTEVDLEYLRSPSESTILRDEDHTTLVEAGWKNINTLKHYWVSDNASFRILTRKEAAPPGRVYDYLGSLISTHTRRQRALSEAEDGSRVWHLFKQVDSEDPRRSPFLNKKLVSEIYLPRMLSTKSILQNFVDELFNALFSVNHPPPSPTTMSAATFPQSPGIQVPMGYAPGADTVPMAIKYLFDFLDEEAELHKITDPDVVHTWKNNALSLRFWVNMIKNPEFVFDINKSHTVDACLSVIAQAFIDGCSPAEMKLTIDSPTSKLLYNKEVQGYKSKVKKYYSNVKNMPKIPEDAMEHYLRQLSEYQCQQMKKVGSFEQDTALNELLRYATHYSNQFLHTLRAAGLQHRAQQFENILKLTQATTSTLL